MNKFCSIFSQLLQLFPRVEFQQMVKEVHAERHAKGFTCWGQFVSMLFCQLGRAHSLREITGGLRSCEGKLKHLGITAPSHSSLAYANGHRPWELYQEVFLKLFERCRVQAIGKKKFRFKNRLISMDSTVIDMCLEMYDWAHFAAPRGRLNSICFWITKVIFRGLPSSRKERFLMSRPPICFNLTLERLSWMIGVIMTMPSLVDGPPKVFIS